MGYCDQPQVARAARGHTNTACKEPTDRASLAGLILRGCDGGDDRSSSSAMPRWCAPRDHLRSCHMAFIAAIFRQESFLCTVAGWSLDPPSEAHQRKG